MNWVARNWLILAAYLLALTLLAGFLEGTGFGRIGLAVLVVGWWAAAAVALADGVCRILGRPCLLGPGRGFNRLLAAIQVILATLLLASLLSSVL